MVEKEKNVIIDVNIAREKGPLHTQCLGPKHKGSEALKGQWAWGHPQA